MSIRPWVASSTDATREHCTQYATSLRAPELHCAFRKRKVLRSPSWMKARSAPWLMRARKWLPRTVETRRNRPPQAPRTCRSSDAAQPTNWPARPIRVERRTSRAVKWRRCKPYVLQATKMVAASARCCSAEAGGWLPGVALPQQNRARALACAPGPGHTRTPFASARCARRGRSVQAWVPYDTLKTGDASFWPVEWHAILVARDIPLRNA